MKPAERKALQRLVNEGYAHILATGKKSLSGTSCAYSGSGCAAACALKPEYRAEADSSDNSSLHHILTNKKSWVQPWALALPRHQACSFQNCHDHTQGNEHFIPEFQKKVEAFCIQHDLSYPGD